MRNTILLILFVLCAALGTASFFYILQAPDSEPGVQKEFTVRNGAGVREIGIALYDAGIVRSPTGFYLLSLATRSAGALKSGEYLLSTAMSPRDVLAALVKGPSNERTVTVIEGMTIYDIDALLAKQDILPAGALITYRDTKSPRLEGYLFPDTYRFFKNTTTTAVVEKMMANFAEKAGSLLQDEHGVYDDDVLILASILEKEVPDTEERRVVAGLLLKRLRADMPLQVDASLCYAKQVATQSNVSCGDITALDLENPSPYNSYLQRGFPPGPIGNPGKDAITAALNPLESPYWFYLSDPETGKTVFAATLDEHRRNKVKYLDNS